MIVKETSNNSRQFLLRVPVRQVEAEYFDADVERSGELITRC